MMDEVVRCLRCRRPLSDPKSVEKMFGPICWGYITKGNNKIDYGLPRAVSDPMLAGQSLRDLHQEVIEKGNRKKCYCGNPFYACDLWSFDHVGGQDISGFQKKQHLFLHCSKCGSDTALWKLGL